MVVSGWCDTLKNGVGQLFFGVADYTTLKGWKVGELNPTIPLKWPTTFSKSERMVGGSQLVLWLTDHLFKGEGSSEEVANHFKVVQFYAFFIMVLVLYRSIRDIHAP
jgi:hypothetical protein